MKSKLKKVGLHFKKEWWVYLVSCGLVVISSIFATAWFILDETTGVRVDGKPIDQIEYSDRLNTSKNLYASLGYDLDNNPELSNYVKKELILKMITSEYEEALAKELGVSYTNSELDRFIRDSGYSSHIYKEKTAAKMVRSDFVSLLNKQAVIAKVIESEDKLKAYFEANKEQMQGSKTKKTEQLIFTDKEVADRILSEIKNGKSLSDFEGEGAVYVTANVAESETALSNFVRELKKNEVSEVVSFGGNYFIIKSLNDQFEGVDLSFEEAKPLIVSALIESEGTKYYNDLVTKHIQSLKITFE